MHCVNVFKDSTNRQEGRLVTELQLNIDVCLNFFKPSRQALLEKQKPLDRQTNQIGGCDRVNEIAQQCKNTVK